MTISAAPSEASQADVAIAFDPLQHADAGTMISPLAIETVEATPLAAADQARPAASASGSVNAAPRRAVASPGDQASLWANAVAALTDAAVPRPRTLVEQVSAYDRITTDDAEQDCLANAVYFEARGEPIEGQLAVANVVLNRVASGRYPGSICGVVTQPAQFSFVRNGVIPNADRSSESWRHAVAIARIAQADGAREVEADVLWYHAAYVSPSWGRRLTRQARIGQHIFYS